MFIDIIIVDIDSDDNVVYHLYTNTYAYFSVIIRFSIFFLSEYF